MIWWAVPVLAGLILVLWLRRLWLRRRSYSERASRPRELANAELVCMEKLFRIRAPIRLVAKVDRVYRLPGGSLVLVELKTRWRDRAYPSDVIQLSAQKIAIERQTGEVVEPFAFVSVLRPTFRRHWTSYRVRLLEEDRVVALAQRRTQILASQVEPTYASSVRACAGCAFRVKCDHFAR
ncbi:PD-(D/E)XK nuclease family protein [Paucibacter sp. O1-1]|nr:PD-(D/E)XK nuclease family protein [Paucibacter sp. O1-1]MDA3824520.1 PD-(D/E)XK nuclease family protein [Paucibacter sp. O1-1]